MRSFAGLFAALLASNPELLAVVPTILGEVSAPWPKPSWCGLTRGRKGNEGAATAMLESLGIGGVRVS